MTHTRQTGTAQDQAFVPCRLAEKGQIVRSNGERLPITNPRVKIYTPNFSHYHIQAAAMAAPWLGLHTGEVGPPERVQLERGLQYTSGRERLPLAFFMGGVYELTASS